MKDHPAQKAEYTAEKIKEMLFSGALKRGDKLPSESRLAAELGVGRSSVREGLRLLDASGYVEIIPNRGAFAAATCEEEIPSPRSWLEINAEKVAVRTLSGDVNVSSLVGSLYINSTSGDVTVEDCQLKTCGVITTSGDIFVECDMEELSCSSASGDVEITAIGQMPSAIKAATTSGDVRLEMIAADGFTLAYRTVSGDISYDVDALDQWTEQRESGKKGAIIYRSGQPGQVQISTVSGDIDLTLEP